jgi:hypothetical protein
MVFFSWEKHIISHFFGVFEKASTSFLRQIALRFTQDNLDIKKVSAPLRKPREMADYGFFSPNKHNIPHLLKTAVH